MITPPIPDGLRPRVSMSRLLLTVVIITCVSTMGLGITVTLDFARPGTISMEIYLTALALAVASWLAVVIVARWDSSAKHASLIEDRLDDLATSLQTLNRKHDAAVIALHDEINAWATEHTGEIKNLADAIRAYGEERETEGELAGIRAVASGEVPAPGATSDRNRLRPVR